MSNVTRRPAASPIATPTVATAQQRTRWLTWLIRLLSTTALLVMVTASVQLVRTWAHDTPIRRVVITSPVQQLSLPDLQTALDAAVRGNFFTANLDDLQALCLRFPSVASARVGRQWPDTLVVAVREKLPVARWGTDALVSNRGEVFRPQLTAAVTELPRLNGPRAQAAFVWQQYQTMDSVLRRVGLHIDDLQLTARMSWVLTLEGGVQVLVDSQDSIAKLERFTMLYDRQLASDMGSIARIDLRYRNGVAIAWRQG